jgi:nicotinate phosphoribosyltransferase
MARAGRKLRGVRLDSGDMIRLSTEARKILDENGLDKVQIFASGSLNEYRIEEALAAGAPIDAFGVGSHLAVSYDVPGLDIVYKLVEYGDRPVLKLSPDKRTLAGRKQIFRRYAQSGEMSEDVIALRDERLEGMSPLLVPVMRNGRRIGDPVELEKVREYATSQLAGLPSPLKALHGTAPYSVRHSDALNVLQEHLVREHDRRSNQ